MFHFAHVCVVEPVDVPMTMFVVNSSRHVDNNGAFSEVPAFNRSFACSHMNTTASYGADLEHSLTALEHVFDE